MLLSEQCVSLDLAKKLKELGVPQNAYWSWYENAGKAHLIHNEGGWRTFENKTFDAFTSSELGELLPEEIHLPNEKSEYWKMEHAFYIQTKYYVAYGLYGTEVIPDCLQFEINQNTSETDARANCLIYLISNKLITLPE